MFQYSEKYERFVMEVEKKMLCGQILLYTVIVTLTFSRRSDYHRNGLSLHVE